MCHRRHCCHCCRCRRRRRLCSCALLASLSAALGVASVIFTAAMIMSATAVVAEEEIGANGNGNGNRRDNGAAAAAAAAARTGKKPSVTIGIAGGTGAGKSTLARAVYAALGGQEHVTYLTHDDYYRDLSHLPLEERASTNFDHPDSLETELLIRHILDLKDGRHVDVPRYDFTVHARKKTATQVGASEADGCGDCGDSIRKHPKEIVLVEGILIFAEPKLASLLDVKVYVEADSDVRLMRRIARDTAERGRSVDEVMMQYMNTVRPMHEEFVEPSKRAADVVVHSEGKGYDVALRMIVNHLRAETGLLPPPPSSSSSSSSSSSKTDHDANAKDSSADGNEEDSNTDGGTTTAPATTVHNADQMGRNEL